MPYTSITAQPTSGQSPWYTTMANWMTSVEDALGSIDAGWVAHADDTTLHLPAGGTNGQVVTKVAGVAAWATPTGGGTSDHGALTGLSDPDHPIAAVIGLQTALDGKSATSHTHSYEPVGTAAAAVSAHEGLGDPHPQYTTSAEVAAAYAPLSAAVPAVTGVTDGWVLTKSGSGFAWALPSGGGSLTPPVALTGTAAGSVPLTVKGASGQTANIFETRLNDNTIALAVTSTGEARLGSNISNQNGHLRVGIVDPARQGIFVRAAAGQTAKLMQLTDDQVTELFSVDSAGYVTATNVGGDLRSVVVLDAAQAVPTTYPDGTVVLRRPA